MTKFIKSYALEIYTFISMATLVIAGLSGICPSSKNLYWCTSFYLLCTNGKKCATRVDLPI